MNITYQIEGMHCSACIEKIKSALSPHFNVISVTFNPALLKIEADSASTLDQLNAELALAGNYRAYLMNDEKIQSPSITHHQHEEKITLLNYYPLILIALYIIGVASINNFNVGIMNWQGWMNQFMAGFFLVFSAFKLLDLKGFAEGYSTYDLLAKHFYAYGFIYPFLELGLGVLYLGGWIMTITQLLTIIIMGFSSLGVINSLLKKQKFKCACLGTILNIPLSSITLIEDLIMVSMAIIGLMLTYSSP